MSLPKIFVLNQSTATRLWLRKLIWLYVSNPLQSKPTTQELIYKQYMSPGSNETVIHSKVSCKSRC